MSGLLAWLYLANSILLINHELDSAYQKEWELFKLPGGITGFLILHFPLLFVILYGLVLLVEGSYWGLICSMILSVGGLFAFLIHTYFLKKGDSKFDQPISKIILWLIFPISIAQLVLTILILKG